MARRSDHSRDELRGMILAHGAEHLAEAGYARFSSREVAKRIGYSLGTIHNVIGDRDDVVMAINTLTFVAWARDLEARLAAAGSDRIAALVEAYFAFAESNENLWSAIYEHRLPPGRELPQDQAERRGRLTGIVAHEVAQALPERRRGEAQAIARSLIATVHGHCQMRLSGALALMGETDAVGAALARVREAIGA